MTQWKPRASSIGQYVGCDMRAALDKLFDQGLTNAVPDRTSSPSADLGTCIHWEMQHAIGCDMSQIAQPTQEQQDNAQKLFSSKTDFHASANKAAIFAKTTLPKMPGVWEAERKYSSALMRGTVDLEQGEVFVDLKTTSRKPDDSRIKSDHLVQMVVYYLLRKAAGKFTSVGYVLYVDSMKAEWAMLMPIDFETVAMREYCNSILKYITYLHTPAMVENAVPRIGAICKDSFCPWKDSCRDKYLPASATTFTVNQNTSPTMGKRAF